MSEKILVIDDERDIANLLEVYLQNENYIVYKYYCAKDAMPCIENEDIDLAILDVMLPDMDGFSLCQLIREKYTYPIIMLTAKIKETDKITGLTLGADDYVTKPFLPLELVARVKAQLRRYERYGARTDQPAENMSFDGNIIENTSANGSYDAADGTYASNHAGTESDDTIICRGILLKKCAHECYLDGDEISLTPTEFTILQALCEAKGRVLSAEELFHIIWKDEYYSKSNNTITVHIRHLREKLKDTGERPKYIKTIWGVGYKIER